MTAVARRTIRAAVHVHSTRSYDGTLELAQVARLLARMRYDCVLVTEHDRGYDARRFADLRLACAAASLPRLTLIPGIEYSDAANRVHLLTWGLDAFLGAARPTRETLRDVRAAGGFAVLAHPRRRDAAAALDDEALALLDGVEVWNRKYDGLEPSDAATALCRRLGAVPFAGLDLHSRRQLFPLAMEIALDASGGPVRERAVLAALHAGRARPVALGLELGRLLAGPGRAGLRVAERARRAARPLARSLRRVRSAA